MSTERKQRLLAIIGPGILVAATGVGAGDLATGALAPGESGLGLAILWAVLVGAGLKFVLNEGLARWQLATGDTLLEGAVRNLGRPIRWGFLIYLSIWSFWVASALMSGCGATAHAIRPLTDDAGTNKIIYGISHSIVAVVLVRLGGYRLFERVMSVCIALMFVTVVATAVAIQPAWGEVAAGMIPHNVFESSQESLQWTVGLMGGVGGTLTILCYGYWIREEGRGGIDDLRTCRIDLATGYTMTALFGLAMVIIGSCVDVEGKGSGLLVQLSGQLESELGSVGPAARWAFLVGAWGAIFSSLLGVWQSVPYLFADFWLLRRDDAPGAERDPVDPSSWPYRIYLYSLATVPMIGLWFSFKEVQKAYAIIGATFIPLLAVVLLILNGPAGWLPREHRNGWRTTIALVAALVFFLLYGWFELQKLVAG